MKEKLQNLQSSYLNNNQISKYVLSSIKTVLNRSTEIYDFLSLQFESTIKSSNPIIARISKYGSKIADKALVKSEKALTKIVESTIDKLSKIERPFTESEIKVSKLKNLKIQKEEKQKEQTALKYELIKYDRCLNSKKQELSSLDIAIDNNVRWFGFVKGDSKQYAEKKEIENSFKEIDKKKKIIEKKLYNVNHNINKINHEIKSVEKSGLSILKIPSAKLGNFLLKAGNYLKENRFETLAEMKEDKEFILEQAEEKAYKAKDKALSYLQKLNKLKTDFKKLKTKIDSDKTWRETLSFGLIIPSDRVKQFQQLDSAKIILQNEQNTFNMLDKTYEYNLNVAKTAAQNCKEKLSFVDKVKVRIGSFIKDPSKPFNVDSKKLDDEMRASRIRSIPASSRSL